MTENAKTEASIKEFLKDQEVNSASLLTQSGYVALCFSPLASEDFEAGDKLGIVLTLQEWLAIGALLDTESKLITSPFYSNRLIEFLRGAIQCVATEHKLGTLLEYPGEQF